MSGDRYHITNQHQTCFITCTVVEWIDLFTRPIYKQIIVDSLNHCIQNNGLILNGWVLMSNHLHFAGRCPEPYRMSDFLRDFKKHTSKALANAVLTTTESRRECLPDYWRGLWISSLLKPEEAVGQTITKYGETITMRSIWQDWTSEKSFLHAWESRTCRYC